MEQVTYTCTSTTLAKEAIERARQQLARGFGSKAMRDAYADYLAIPYGDLYRAVALYCEQQGGGCKACANLLPRTLGQVQPHHLSEARRALPGFTEAVDMVAELLAMRKEIKAAVIQ